MSGDHPRPVDQTEEGQPAPETRPDEEEAPERTPQDRTDLDQQEGSTRPGDEDDPDDERG